MQKKGKSLSSKKDKRKARNMSGGNLNFLASTMCDSLFGYKTDRDYEMICNNANARIARSLNPMHDREISELMADVICLLYGLEWFDSCDIGEETYKECVNKFKAKWMPRIPEVKANSYAEDLKALYKELRRE